MQRANNCSSMAAMGDCREEIHSGNRASSSHLTTQEKEEDDADDYYHDRQYISIDSYLQGKFGEFVSDVVRPKVRSFYCDRVLSERDRAMAESIFPSKWLTDINSGMAPNEKSRKRAKKTEEKSSSRLKATLEWNKDFLDICVEEVNQFGHCGTSLKPLSWDRLMENLGKKYNMQYTQRQLKQKWDYFRRQYQAWRVLENKTGNGYDAVTGTFNFLDEVWEDIIKKYPLAGQFRTSTLEHKDLIQTVFGSTVATGEVSFSPKHPLPVENPRSTHILDTDDEEGHEDFGNEYQDGAQEAHTIFNSFFPNATFDDCASGDFTSFTQGSIPSSQVHDTPPLQEQSATHASQEQRKPRVSGSRRKRDKLEDPLVKSVESLVELVKANYVADNDVADEVLEKLNRLLELGQLDDDLYVGSLRAFSMYPAYNKPFLKVQGGDELKVKFLEAIAK